MLCDDRGAKAKLRCSQRTELYHVLTASGEPLPRRTRLPYHVIPNHNRTAPHGPLVHSPSLAPGTLDGKWLGICVVLDRATGNGYVVGLWKREADAHAFETSGAFQSLLAQYPPGILIGPPLRSIADVVFHASAERTR